MPSLFQQKTFFHLRPATDTLYFCSDLFLFVTQACLSPAHLHHVFHVQNPLLGRFEQRALLRHAASQAGCPWTLDEPVGVAAELGHPVIPQKNLAATLHKSYDSVETQRRGLRTFEVCCDWTQRDPFEKERTWTTKRRSTCCAQPTRGHETEADVAGPDFVTFGEAVVEDKRNNNLEYEPSLAAESSADHNQQEQIRCRRHRRT